LITGKMFSVVTPIFPFFAIVVYVFIVLLLSHFGNRVVQTSCHSLFCADGLPFWHIWRSSEDQRSISLIVF